MKIEIYVAGVFRDVWYHQFDPRLNGVEYVTKCLSGSALGDGLGGNFYEGSEFAHREAEVTLSNSLARAGRRWLDRHSPLRGCSGLATLVAAKVPRRRNPFQF